jgi:hypothetical protein
MRMHPRRAAPPSIYGSAPRPGKVDEPIHVVVLVQVDDALDRRHAPRLDRRVVRRTPRFRASPPFRDIELAKQLRAWCAGGRSLSRTGFLPEPAQVLLNQG